jgi:uncharacterized protein YcnI
MHSGKTDMKTSKRGAVLALLLAAGCGEAFAHVVLHEKSAPVGTYYKGTFMVGHGCGASPTVAVTVKFSEEFIIVKPSPKPGWTIETRKVALDKPYDSYGRMVSERVSEVTWRGGKLDTDQYDEFVVLLRLPASPGKRYFAVSQKCEDGSMDWSDIPAEGKTRRDYKWPAAELDVVPAAAATAAEGSHKH